jgi:hypothetical protein
MRTRLGIYLPLVILAVVACRYRPEPFPVRGSPSAIGALAGEWIGEYQSRESGRSGAITFQLEAGRDTAYGDVLMSTGDQRFVLRPTDAPDAHRAHVKSAQALRVLFATIASGEVSGRLEPYVAPDCDCVVTTTFTGVVDGSTISGTYFTRGPMGWIQRGSWRAVRRIPDSIGEP